MKGRKTRPTNVAEKEQVDLDRQTVLRHLESSRDGLLTTVHGLSETQWKFQPGPDRWSAENCVEHLAIIENIFVGIFGRMPGAPAPEPGRDLAQIDAMVLQKTVDRSNRIQVPNPGQPTGRWGTPGTLEQFPAARVKIAMSLTLPPSPR